MTEQEMIELYNKIADEVVENDLEIIFSTTSIQSVAMTLGGARSIDIEDLLMWNVSMVCYGRFCERVEAMGSKSDDEIASYLLRNFKMPNFGDKQ